MAGRAWWPSVVPSPSGSGPIGTPTSRGRRGSYPTHRRHLSAPAQRPAGTARVGWSGPAGKHDAASATGLGSATACRVSPTGRCGKPTDQQEQQPNVEQAQAVPGGAHRGRWKLGRLGGRRAVNRLGHSSLLFRCNGGLLRDGIPALAMWEARSRGPRFHVWALQFTSPIWVVRLLARSPVWRAC
jgi:hypothetical protein